jgi:hypothetical protein
LLGLLTPTPSKLPGRHSAVEQHLPQAWVEQHPPQVEVEQHPPQVEVEQHPPQVEVEQHPPQVEVEVQLLHQRRLRVHPVPLEVELAAFICHFSRVRPKFLLDTVVFQFAACV